MSQSQTSPHLFLSALLFLAIVFAAIISIHAIAVTAQDWKMREEDDGAWNNLVGVEEYCKERKEECLKGRMMHEAHLDYIYTQHHPKP